MNRSKTPKTKKPAKKLDLKRQKVRNLSESKLAEAHGGMSCRVTMSQDACSCMD